MTYLALGLELGLGRPAADQADAEHDQDKNALHGARLVPVDIRCEAMPRNAFQRLVVRRRRNEARRARVRPDGAACRSRHPSRDARAGDARVVGLGPAGGDAHDDRPAQRTRRSSTPIVAVPEGDALVLVGSNFGQAHHPAWVHNLRAEPRAWVDGREVRAEEIEGPERERLLALATEVYPGFPAYVQRAAPRRIAVMRLR